MTTPSKPPPRPESLRGYPLRAFFICLVSVSLANMDQALFGYVMPLIRKDFGVSLEAFGWLFAISFAAAGVTIAGLGALADRVGDRRHQFFQNPRVQA